MPWKRDRDVAAINTGITRAEVVKALGKPRHTYAGTTSYFNGSLSPVAALGPDRPYESWIYPSDSCPLWTLCRVIGVYHKTYYVNFGSVESDSIEEWRVVSTSRIDPRLVL